MELAVYVVRLLIAFPFIALEAVIKTTMTVVYVPMCIILAVFYPLVKYHLRWTKKWWKYATTWCGGFHSIKIYKLWKFHSI